MRALIRPVVTVATVVALVVSGVIAVLTMDVAGGGSAQATAAVSQPVAQPSCKIRPISGHSRKAKRARRTEHLRAYHCRLAHDALQGRIAAHRCVLRVVQGHGHRAQHARHLAKVRFYRCRERQWYRRWGLWQRRLAAAATASVPTNQPQPSPTPTPTTTPTATPTPAPPSTDPGWTLVGSDEFDGTVLDTTKWTPMNGVPGCCKSSLWDPSMVSESDGVVHLKNAPDASGRWLSGGIGSWAWDKGVLKYGRVDARMRFDAGLGVSAAALLWPDHNASWPPELDFYEIGRQVADRSEVMITNHYKALDANGSALAPEMTQSWDRADFTQWHVVSTRWSPDLLVVLVDGVEKFRETDPDKISNLPMWIGFQTHVEPVDGAPTLAAGQQSIDLDVDWVRIYQPS